VFIPTASSFAILSSKYALIPEISKSIQAISSSYDYRTTITTVSTVRPAKGYFSRLKLRQPEPPLPALTVMTVSSINFIAMKVCFSVLLEER
jgi:hypothetical protein